MKKEASFTDKVYQAACQVLVDELNPRFQGRAIVSYEPDAYGFHYIVVRRFKSLKQVWGMQVDWGVMDKMLTFNTYPDMVAKKIQEVLVQAGGEEYTFTKIVRHDDLTLYVDHGGYSEISDEALIEAEDITFLCTCHPCRKKFYEIRAIRIKKERDRRSNPNCL